MVLKLLLEGSSVSTVERITDVHHTTILKLLVLAGEQAHRFSALPAHEKPVCLRVLDAA